jgi:hypothetical protein
VRRNLALGLAALTVAAAAGVLYGPGPVSIVAGLMLAFGLPGAGLTAILFRTRSALSGYERFTFIPALSLATVVLGGLIAWVAGLSLDRNTWVGVSGGVALLGLLAAAAWPAADDPAHTAATAAVPLGTPAARDRSAPPPPANVDSTQVMQVGPDRPGAAAEGRTLGRRLTREVLPLILVAALLGGASWLSLTSSRDAHNVEIISLSAVPPGPPNATGDRIVRVSAAGLPARSTSYSVVVIDDVGEENQRRQITADADGGWTADLTLPGDERMTIGLYRPGESTPYRTVIIADAN